MRVPNSARFAAACLMAGALACASNTAKVDDGTAAAQDTTTTEAPPGYSGMERDTTMKPDSAPTATDTFLQQQGTGVPADTQGYGGLEKQDSSAVGAPQSGQTGYDTTSAVQPGQTGYDTTGYSQQPGQSDTTGMSHMDTTGMGHSGTDSVPQ